MADASGTDGMIDQGQSDLVGDASQTVHIGEMADIDGPYAKDAGDGQAQDRGLSGSGEEGDASHAHRPRRRFSQPIALFVVRYFLYVLCAAVALVLGGVLLWQTGVNKGVIYPANYAENHMNLMVHDLASSTGIRSEAIPSAYRYAIYTDEGEPVGGDIPSDMAGEAAQAVRHYQQMAGHGSADPEPANPSTSPAAMHYRAFGCGSGRTCLLAYNLMPQWAAKSARDRCLGPQGTFLCVAAVLFVLALTGIGWRAARVMTRKLDAFTTIADAVARQDLDFTVPTTSIREINRTLAAFERMRGALKDSLQRQFSLEAARKRQIAALAHDVKTPITIVRGNADLLGETALDAEQRSYLAFIGDATQELGDYAAAITSMSTTGRDEPPASLAVPDFLGRLRA